MRKARPGRTIAAFVIGACALGRAASAGLIEFTDKTEWEAAVGDFTTIGFTEFLEFTHLTDEYADQGVVFTSGIVQVSYGLDLWPNDGWGVGLLGDVTMEFDNPQSWLAVDYPGAIRFELYSAGQLIFTSSDFFVQGPSGVGGFAGLISSVPFDEVLVYDWLGDGVAGIDDLHFGVIPGPASMAVILSSLMFARRSRT